MKQYEIYTDGGAYNNKDHPKSGFGACAYIIIYGKKVIKEKVYKKEGTTNNRMELSAIIAALQYVKENLYSKENPCEIYINTDSQYVKNGITSWINKWKKNGWKTANNKDVSNKDLWIMLDKLNSKISKINWQWVRGHNGNKYNEAVDKMCTKVMKL